MGMVLIKTGRLYLKIWNIRAGNLSENIKTKEKNDRFCCDRHWEDIQDMDYNSVFGATDQLPGQYREVEPDWQTK